MLSVLILKAEGHPSAVVFRGAVLPHPFPVQELALCPAGWGVSFQRIVYDLLLIIYYGYLLFIIYYCGAVLPHPVPVQELALSGAEVLVGLATDTTAYLSWRGEALKVKQVEGLPLQRKNGVFALILDFRLEVSRGFTPVKQKFLTGDS